MPGVLLGVTGCIAAYKACEILRELQRHQLDVRVAMTRHAQEFVGRLTFEALSGHAVYSDPFALGSGAEMPHVHWSQEADLLLVAPATANVIGKLAHGIADDALTTLCLAATAPVVVAPAMNVEMWRHPAVTANLETLKARGVRVVEPGVGCLACGTIGQGRLAEVEEIVAAALSSLTRRHDLDGWHVVVTAGPTREAIDPVRFLSNRSSGRMGLRLAEAARERGARVTLVSGPTALAAPAGVELVSVVSAEEMAAAVREHAASARAVVMAAAVSDHRPARRFDSKVKKDALPESIELVANPDILKGLGQEKGARLLVGFAAETEDVVENGRRKLVEKNLDLIVANDVGAPGVGFEGEMNAATLIDARGVSVVPRCSKRELAERIWDRVLALSGRQPGQTP
jgi:phosphopantothenoylcysteine decarboxylase/phosphopantothenate--cysteine ligase